MAKIPDSTKLIHMNLPGTHDTATCKKYSQAPVQTLTQLTGNYTEARQKELLRYTGESVVSFL